MSNAVYPTLPGLMFPVERVPKFKTLVKSTPSGREYRGAQMTSPLYTYNLQYEFLRDTSSIQELRTLVGFFNARQGSFDTFLFSDPDDSSVTAQLFGTGDGATTQFQLLRSYGGNVEPVYDLNGAPTIYVNGVARTAGTDYTINSTGGVTFTVAPGATLPVTWSGAFYWRVRFNTDDMTVSKFMNQLWEAQKVSLITVKP